MSLEQVVELLDRNLGDISALDTSNSKRRVRHSTPDRADSHGDGLELVGREMQTHARIKTSKKAVTVRSGSRNNVNMKSNKGRGYWKD